MTDFTGHIARCRVDRYMSVKRSELRLILHHNLADGTIVLANRYSPVGYSSYRIENFSILNKSDSLKHKDKAEMLHVAILWPEGHNYASFTDLVISAGGLPKSMADSSLSALKERVKMDIQQNPGHRWLMLSGNTIAETSAPPVTFRQF